MLKPPSAWRWQYLGNIYFIAVERLHELPVMSNRWGLRIEQSQVCNVPWVAHVLVCLRVLQPVGATSADFGDNEWSFPLGGKFMDLLLYQRRTRLPLFKVLVRKRLLW